MTHDTPNPRKPASAGDAGEIVARLRDYDSSLQPEIVVNLIEQLQYENSEMRRTYGSHPLFKEKDDLIEQLQRKLKNYEPIALYNGKNIETYARELAAANARIAEARKLLNDLYQPVRGRLQHFVVCSRTDDPSEDCDCGSTESQIWIDAAPPAVSTTTTVKDFYRFDTDDSSTLNCPCGATFTWWGAANEGLDEWRSKHKPHLSTPPAGSKEGAHGQGKPCTWNPPLGGSGGGSCPICFPPAGPKENDNG